MKVNVTLRDGSERQVAVQPTYHYCPECGGVSVKWWEWHRLLSPNLSIVLNNNLYDRRLPLYRRETNSYQGDYRVVRPWEQGRDFRTAFSWWKERLTILDGLIEGMVDPCIWEHIAEVTKHWSVVQETMESSWWGDDDDFSAKFVDPKTTFWYEKVPAFLEDSNLVKFTSLVKSLKVLDETLEEWVYANSLPPYDYTGICAIHKVLGFTKRAILTCEVAPDGALIVSDERAIRLVIATGEWLSYYEVEERD